MFVVTNTNQLKAHDRTELVKEGMALAARVRKEHATDCMELGKWHQSEMPVDNFMAAIELGGDVANIRSFAASLKSLTGTNWVTGRINKKQGVIQSIHTRLALGARLESTSGSTTTVPIIFQLHIAHNTLRGPCPFYLLTEGGVDQIVGVHYQWSLSQPCGATLRSSYIAKIITLYAGDLLPHLDETCSDLEAAFMSPQDIPGVGGETITWQDYFAHVCVNVRDTSSNALRRSEISQLEARERQESIEHMEAFFRFYHLTRQIPNEQLIKIINTSTSNIDDLFSAHNSRLFSKHNLMYSIGILLKYISTKRVDVA